MDCYGNYSNDLFPMWNSVLSFVLLTISSNKGHVTLIVRKCLEDYFSMEHIDA